MPIELELPNFVLLEESSRYLHLCVFVQKAILYHRPVYLREQQSYIAVQYIFARTAILYHRSVYLREQQSYIAVQYICANSNLISPFSIFARTAFLVLYFLLEPCSGPPFLNHNSGGYTNLIKSNYLIKYDIVSNINRLLLSCSHQVFRTGILKIWRSTETGPLWTTKLPFSAPSLGYLLYNFNSTSIL